MKKDPRSIIINPIVTEKTTGMKESSNKVQFKVARRANKIEIHDAIEKIFNVKVKTVSTMNYKGKIKRLGRYEGKRADWKKAIITLQEGHTIEFFEGV